FFFYADREPWVSDGTLSGTFSLVDADTALGPLLSASCLPQKHDKFLLKDDSPQVGTTLKMISYPVENSCVYTEDRLASILFSVPTSLERQFLLRLGNNLIFFSYGGDGLKIWKIDLSSL
ncbi:MAG: hypothetical protein KTR35_07820, partial [Gammaproteobacteria bacterium]|nr:hypothetical protein [Gammaproteobacteria bacterium]